MSAPLDLPAIVFNFLRDRREKRDIEKGHSGPQEHFHFSALGHPCMRKAVLERTGSERKPMRDESIAVTDYGYLVEGILESAIMSWVTREGSEWNMYTQVRVSAPGFIGTLDWLLRHKTDGRVILLDSKSASGGSLSWKLREGTNTEYANQVGGYAEALATQPAPVVVMHIGLLYMNKEYGDLHAIWFDVEECRAKARARMEEYRLAFAKVPTLPDELPFATALSANNKHVKSGRAKKGEQVPHGLCSPLYCSVLNACPIVRAWWDSHPLQAES